MYIKTHCRIIGSNSDACVFQCEKPDFATGIYWKSISSQRHREHREMFVLLDARKGGVRYKTPCPLCRCAESLLNLLNILLMLFSGVQLFSVRYNR